MQTIKVNGIEIEFADSIEITVENKGKRIVVKSRTPAAPEVRFIPYTVYPTPGFIPYPVYRAPVWSSPFTFTIPSAPWNAGTSTINVDTSGNVSSSGNISALLAQN